MSETKTTITKIFNRTQSAHVYIARKDCGCVAGLTNDRADKFTADHVADFIKSGCAVNRHTWAEYQEITKEETFFACPHGQQDFFGVVSNE